MYNSNSLLTGIKKLVSSINMTDKTRIASPVPGFIDSEVSYLSTEVEVKEIMLESSYKKILPKLRSLIEAIPEDKQAVDPVVYSHSMNNVMVYKANTKDGFPYVLLVMPSMVDNLLYFRIRIMIAFATIKKADEFYVS